MSAPKCSFLAGYGPCGRTDIVAQSREAGGWARCTIHWRRDGSSPDSRDYSERGRALRALFGELKAIATCDTSDRRTVYASILSRAFAAGEAHGKRSVMAEVERALEAAGASL